MKTTTKSLAVLAAVLVLCSGQQLRARQAETPTTARSRIRVYFSALDSQEKPVLGLSADRFELRIDGRSASLEGFRPGVSHDDRSVPLLLWILIDWNPNVNAEMMRRQAEAAAKAFDLFNGESRIGVKLVSDRSETLEPLAHDPAGLRRAFAGFSERRGELRVGAGEGSVVVGPAGLLGAVDHAIDDLVRFPEGQPALEGREVRRAIMIISDGNVNPGYKRKPLYEKAARANVWLYPVFVPRARYGPWVEDYFELAKKTGGVASVFGALAPGSKILPLPKGSVQSNALAFNFMHVARDISGKYSFEVVPPQEGKAVRLDLKSRAKNVQIRLARRALP